MSSALLVIDMQLFVDQRIQRGIGFYPTNAKENMVKTLKEFRKKNIKIIHIMHESPDPESILHHSSEYYPLINSMRNLEDEPIFIKNTSSAFSSTKLEAFLKEMGVSNLFVIGAVAGFCVNTTTRHGADLGFDMTVIQDAVISFDIEGEVLTGKNIHDVTFGLLKSDFAKVIDHSELK